MTKRKIAQRIPFTPSKTQAQLLEQCFGDRRFAYNQQVEAFNTYDKETNPNPEYPNVTDMKNAHAWLRDSPIPSNALSNAIMDFRKARSAYFRKADYGKHRPRFATRHDNIQSFRNTMPIRRMDGNRYPLSKKLGSVRIRKRDRLRYPIESLSSWTVKRENRTYYLVLLFDVDVRPKPPSGGMHRHRLGRQGLSHAQHGRENQLPDTTPRFRRKSEARTTPTVAQEERVKQLHQAKAKARQSLREAPSLPRRLPAPTVPQADRREPIHRHGDPDGAEHDAKGEGKTRCRWQADAQRSGAQTRDEPFHTPRWVERPRGQAVLQDGMVRTRPYPGGQVLPQFQTLPRMRVEEHGTDVA